MNHRWLYVGYTYVRKYESDNNVRTYEIMYIYNQR